jgi:15-cis-phytoene synthase
LGVRMNELDAAGIVDPALRKSYQACKRLNAEHGKTYYLATLLLPKAKRPFVHALYGFARYADEIVDDLSSTLTSSQKADLLTSWGAEVLEDIHRGESSDPIAKAFVDTVIRWHIPVEHVEAFLNSMAMDLTITEYQTFDDLYRYVYGSAAVIGLQMVPILEPTSEEAYQSAMDLGVAFQLANFIRDVGEDLERGRIYLPLEELRSFGVNRSDLEKRVLTPQIIAALQMQVARVRDLQSRAAPGIALLHPTSRPCIQAASELYCGIVDEVEEIGYDVFTKRARTSAGRRLSVALPAWVRAVRARRGYRPALRAVDPSGTPEHP